MAPMSHAQESFLLLKREAAEGQDRYGQTGLPTHDVKLEREGSSRCRGRAGPSA